MLIDDLAQTHDRREGGFTLGPSEIVMGLHWDPPQEDVEKDPDDLDALCVLFDAQRRMVEVVHPGFPRNATGSVIHTGDSRTGASVWDDERIFVFLEALPETVTELAFVVASAKGKPLNQVRGAACHVTDHVTERELMRLELASLGQRDAHCVATVRRGASGWAISTDVQPGSHELLAELRAIMGNGKCGESPMRPPASS